MEQITLNNISEPAGKSMNDALQWFCDSLGLISLRDKDNSCYRLFIELLKASKLGKPLSSDELSSKLNLARGTVVHHLNRLIESGLVVVKDNRYSLKAKNLKDLISLVKKDVGSTLDNLEIVADKLDKSL